MRIAKVSFVTAPDEGAAVEMALRVYKIPAKSSWAQRDLVVGGE